MNSVLLSIILIPILEIYLFIKIGSQIGAFNTILLILSSSRWLLDFIILEKNFKGFNISFWYIIYLHPLI